MDVVELRVGKSVVMRGLGGCKFEDASAAWNFDGGDAWATAFAAEWEHGATWPSLAIGTYIDRTGTSIRGVSCTDNWLLRPKSGAAQFDARIPLKPSFLHVVDAVHRLEPFGHTEPACPPTTASITSEGTEQLWRVDPGQPPSPYTAKDGWMPLKIWGMGIASTDVNGDGYPDYFLTSMADNKLQTFTNPPADGQVKPDFKDVALAKNVHRAAPVHRRRRAPEHRLARRSSRT